MPIEGPTQNASGCENYRDTAAKSHGFQRNLQTCLSGMELSGRTWNYNATASVPYKIRRQTAAEVRGVSGVLSLCFQNCLTLYLRSCISVRELLKKAEVVKEKQRKSDIEELKRSNEKLRKQSGLDWTAQKRENRQSSVRKDAPPYKVDITSLFLWTY